jgi:Do/DeqQ family serine protease
MYQKFKTMKNIGKYSFTFLLVIAGGFVAVWAYSRVFDKPQIVTVTETQHLKYAGLDSEGNLPDLTFAAEKSIHAVVHIATQSVRGGGWTTGNPFFDEFFGLRGQPQQLAQGFGSGVILSADGYIVTNNHVIEDAQKIKVILNDKREFEAKLVGTDPSTDIALLKVDAKELPCLTYGDSNSLKLGEWVLAVGNPFNLTSTVTAGIVSARARNLGINESQMAIESFIQTDAAVNPGNSGGALVNQQGYLVGINTAIASRTGSYSGYSFAVPVSIVKKVVEDLKKFGEVQRALLGVNIGDIDAGKAKELGLDKVEGVYIGGVPENGAAHSAGIKEGDVIIQVENEPIKNTALLQEKISQYRPGDAVHVVVIRDKEKKQFKVTLRNKNGDTQVVRNETDILGAEFEEVSAKEKDELGIGSGIKIKSVGKGKLKTAGLKEGFIITSVNKKPIFEVMDFKREIGNARGGILLEGLYENGEQAYFVFGLD